MGPVALILFLVVLIGGMVSWPAQRATAGLGYGSPPTIPDVIGPGDAPARDAVLLWAVAHVGRYTYNLGAPTDRGGSVQDMRSREPSGSTCDCSMYARWAFAQGGIEIGLTTSTQWTANGRLPSGDMPQANGFVARGVGAQPPPGGYQPADLIFFGVDDGPTGHVAMWLGDGQIVQCSSSGGGSNIRPLAGYVAPTGWVRWAFGVSVRGVARSLSPEMVAGRRSGSGRGSAGASR